MDRLFRCVKAYCKRGTGRLLLNTERSREENEHANKINWKSSLKVVAFLVYPLEIQTKYWVIPLTNFLSGQSQSGVPQRYTVITTANVLNGSNWGKRQWLSRHKILTLFPLLRIPRLCQTDIWMPTKASSFRGHHIHNDYYLPTSDWPTCVYLRRELILFFSLWNTVVLSSPRHFDF